MFSRDKFGPLTLLSGMMTGYQLSSEILETKYHKDDRDKLNVVLQDLLKVPSPVLRKNAEKVQRKLEERLEQYLEMNKLYDEMIGKLEKEVADVTVSMEALYKSKDDNPSTLLTVQKNYEFGSADTDRDFARIKARHIGDTSIGTLANVVNQLKEIDKKEKDIQQFKTMTQAKIQNDFDKFRILYLYSHSHNYRYFVDNQPQSIIPKMYNPPDDSSDANISSQLKGITVDKPKTKLLPIFVGESTLPFMRTLLALRRVSINDNIRAATVKYRPNSEIKAPKPQEMYDLLDGKTTKNIDLQTLVVPRAFEVHFQEMHLSQLPTTSTPKWDGVPRRESRSSEYLACPSQIIRRENLSEFGAGRRKTTKKEGTGDAESKCYVPGHVDTWLTKFRRWDSRDGYYDSPVDVQDMYDYFTTHNPVEEEADYEKGIERLIARAPEKMKPIDGTYLDSVRKERQVLNMILKERNIMQKIAQSIGFTEEKIEFTKTMLNAQYKFDEEVRRTQYTIIKPVPILSVEGEKKSIMKELYCQPRDSLTKPITFMDFHRNPGAQPIYNFGVFTPSMTAKDSTEEKRSLHFKDEFNYTKTNNWAMLSGPEKDVHTKNYPEMNMNRMTDLGFDFPRIDSETFTKIVDPSGDDTALFFFRYMHENWKNKFLSTAFPTEDKLKQFADNLTDIEYQKFLSERGDLRKNTAESFCEYLILLTKHDEFKNFYLNYLQVGGCSEDNNKQAEKYNEWATQMINSNRPETEDVIIQKYSVEGEMEENKLYRCYKILNALHALLKNEYEVYRGVNNLELS